MDLVEVLLGYAPLRREKFRKLTGCLASPIFVFSGEKTIDCIGRAFRKIPEHLPLDASYVYLSYNRIEMVSAADMQDLRSIKVLDLSHNKIKV